MIARLKHKHHQAENDRGNREYWRREKALDEALKNTFPASDPVSVEQPGLPAQCKKGCLLYPKSGRVRCIGMSALCQ